MKKFKVKKKWKISKVLIVGGILIFFFTSLFVRVYVNKVSKKVVDYANLRLEEAMEAFLSQSIGVKTLNSNLFDNLLSVKYNKEGEIVSASYDFAKVYEALEEVTDVLYEEIHTLESGKNKSYKNSTIVNYPEGIALKVPVFFSSSSVLFASLGPKICIPVKFVGAILTNIRTEIKDYGLNNAMVEVYITVKITTNLVSALNKSENVIDYNVLVASTVINGKVPNVYGAGLVQKSSDFSIPLE